MNSVSSAPLNRGTGKTTFLSRQVKHAAEKFGNEAVLVTSFTRAAAAELVGRDLPISRDNIGTLHAHCYRAIGHPEIAESKIQEWNKENPLLGLSTTGGSLDEGAADQTFGNAGDQVYSEMQRLRARMVDRRLWKPATALFAEKWDAWKKANELMDFTDLLETAYRDIHVAPSNPSVLICDEAQDFSTLQLHILRRWGRQTEYMLVAGDEDQLLYDFAGCSVDAFLKPAVPDDHKRVLSQSFRVPRAIHARANAWIKTVSVREPKEYLPRDYDGEVKTCDDSWERPERVLHDASGYLAAGKTVMFLAACSYMLEPMRKALRAAGVPFHNPYRRTRGDWNPLAVKGTSTASRLLAFLKPREDVWGDLAGEWSGDQLRRWIELVKADGLLARGGKKAIGVLSPDDPVPIETIAELFDPDSAADMLRVLTEGSIGEAVDWLVKRVISAKEKAVEYPATILSTRGPRGLRERPQVIIGTIHSVKGGEADVVYLFPDLSRAAGNEWARGGESRDNIIRQMYVGMTRARESLVLCEPSAKPSTAYAPM